MSRPGSSAHSVASFHMEDGPIAGPSRSPSNDFYAHQAQQQWGLAATSTSTSNHINGAPEGRIIYPMPGHPAGVVSVMGSATHDDDNEGDFLPMDEHEHETEYTYMHQTTTPFHQHITHPGPGPHLSHPGQHVQYIHAHGHSPYPNSMSTPHPHPHSTSPTAMMGQHGMPLMHVHSPNDGFHLQATPLPQQFYATAGPVGAPPRRPGMAHRHSAMPMSGQLGQHGHGQRPPPLTRQYSLQPPPTRVVDPIGHDVFAMPPGSTPIRRAASAVSEYQPEANYFHQLPQGISPARALGPAPIQRPQFSPSADPLITPQTKQFPHHMPSSAASTVTTDSSTLTSSLSSVDRRRVGSTDEENDSPTRAPKGQLSQMVLDEPARRQIIAPVRLKGVIGGRTSAKFAKVAEDPGVEGVPPGPRPSERPTPSFACIIGQAILRCSAGGLSLEHIYRYVETAYPFFKSGDPAWRNSVRHNLSIHKMFETIPRTEHFPPGKGGIWIIHEEEKIHWPSEDKFIKNFPSSHPHHGCCRQTLHERQKENEAIAKARAEGREYVPKKGKKGKKGGCGAGGDEGMDMDRTDSMDGVGIGESSAMPTMPLQPNQQFQQQQQYQQGMPMSMSMSMPGPMPGQLSMAPGAMYIVPQHQHQHSGQYPPHGMAHPGMQVVPPPPHRSYEGESTTPKMPPKILHPPAFYGDHGDSFQITEMEMEDVPPVAAAPPKGTMVPPRFGTQKRPFDPSTSGDEENVFTAPKRVRVAEPVPLALIHDSENISSGASDDNDIDAYVTPERERQLNVKPIANSSAFKTPGLVNTSSSPGSSPMPTTVPRTAGHGHHPSALQQTWTNDNNDASPAEFTLDEAFDIKPKIRRTDDSDPPLFPHTQSPRGPPKTPLTRSSAAADRAGVMHRTPFGRSTTYNASATLTQTPMMYAGSPVLPRMTSFEMSTPAWEMEGILDRMGVNGGINMSLGTIFSPLLRSPCQRSNSTNSTTGGGANGNGNGGVPLGLRSPLTSTDPSKYATLMSSGDGMGLTSPTKGSGGSGLSMSLLAAASSSPTKGSKEKEKKEEKEKKTEKAASTLAKALLAGSSAAGIKELVSMKEEKRERERTRTRSGGEMKVGVGAA